MSPAAAGAVLLSGALPMLLGGVLALDRDFERRVPAAEAWVYPVGPARDWQGGGPGAPCFRLLRDFGGPTGGPHRGVDLGDGRAGGQVRSCAPGLVLQTADGDTLTAWGNRAVIAHRPSGGGAIYSVYAHLQPGSIRVRPGQVVAAGEPLARVGRSGNATTPHLHFEIRVAQDPTLRWENAEAVDPLAFVAERLEGLPVTGPPEPDGR